MTATVTAAIAELRSILRSSGDAVDQQWRDWARWLAATCEMSPELALGLWKEVLDFDTLLAGYIAEPLPLGVSAVVVAGSGKETFKTFNVSTAASILAVAAGARVIKGVSHSVSAVSGAADVLDELGVPIAQSPDAAVRMLGSCRLAFVSYSAFCPTYAGRYDGVFPFFNPFSYFMPVAVLGVQASSFVYGIARPDVHVAADTLRALRPDIGRGIVVSTSLLSGEVMDEHAGRGTVHQTTVDGDVVRTGHTRHPAASGAWRAQVAHRGSHAENAALLVASLTPEGCAACGELVEYNAALILAAAQWGELDMATARARVAEVRRAGAARQLLSALQDTPREARACSMS